LELLFVSETDPSHLSTQTENKPVSSELDYMSNLMNHLFNGISFRTYEQIKDKWKNHECIKLIENWMEELNELNVPPLDIAIHIVAMYSTMKLIEKFPLHEHIEFIYIIKGIILKTKMFFSSNDSIRYRLNIRYGKNTIHLVSLQISFRNYLHLYSKSLSSST
jgi:hypothetical protein